MGFFAAELENILHAHLSHEGASSWSILSRLGIHPQQIDRLKKAADDIMLVSTMPEADFDRLCAELQLSPLELARLHAGTEADVALRMTKYHGYSDEEVANIANAIYSSSLKDRLTQHGIAYVPADVLSVCETIMQQAGKGRRGRGIRRRVEVPQVEKI